MASTNPRQWIVRKWGRRSCRLPKSRGALPLSQRLLHLLLQQIERQDTAA